MASPVAAGGAMLVVGLVKARSGNLPTPADVEDIMKKGSRVESGLNSYFYQGRTLDLVELAKEVDKRFPAGATPPVVGTPPPACP